MTTFEPHTREFSLNDSDLLEGAITAPGSYELVARLTDEVGART